MRMLDALSSGVRKQLVRAAAHCGGAAVCQANPPESWANPDSESLPHPQRSLFGNKRTDAGAQCLHTTLSSSSTGSPMRLWIQLFILQHVRTHTKYEKSVPTIAIVLFIVFRPWGGGVYELFLDPWTERLVHRYVTTALEGC